MFEEITLSFISLSLALAVRTLKESSNWLPEEAYRCVDQPTTAETLFWESWAWSPTAKLWLSWANWCHLDTRHSRLAGSAVCWMHLQNCLCSPEVYKQKLNNYTRGQAWATFVSSATREALTPVEEFIPKILLFGLIFLIVFILKLWLLSIRMRIPLLPFSFIWLS